ncbi:hypothetical protein ACFPZ0_09845 [Streptomonospora nanhaiensis]|uniref:Uncharacterized protein n=1 Tax=Streptomonospora nanhaiensis TaxID=1323731 RepID=A0A853BUK4_9ACTN|nr:hypothetical protein [Streptomonospora nanhaiensis]MBV2363621.1 hypothetical protein [Streptomonospora nanhaiensis]MBX9390033.1 hypothetical protein [Streptomonospora nanhaiensis]NYI98664.1 hypothetical protein [Streptomonospora nanhaiensis]
MSQPARVDTQTLDRWKWIATRAVEELAMAGLPVTTGLPPSLGGGVEVEVDPLSDPTGGVYLRWQAHGQLIRPALEEFAARSGGAAGEPGAAAGGDSAVRHHDTVCEAMVTAMATILTSAGFTVRRAGEVNDFADGLYIDAAPDPRRLENRAWRP